MNGNDQSDQALRDFYTLNPLAPTPSQGGFNNDTRIRHEVIKQEVTSTSASISGADSGSK